MKNEKNKINKSKTFFLFRKWNITIQYLIIEIN